MSDQLQNGGASPDKDTAPDKHETARRMAEAAMDAQDAGDGDRADQLIGKAEQVDPDAVVDVLAERAEDAVPSPEIVVQSDEEIAALSRTIEPNSGAPSRANITGGGSGADNS